MKKPDYEKKESELNYNKLAEELFKEINNVRTNPKTWIEKLEEDLTYFKENILYRPNEDPLRTQEGPNGHNEAIDFLKKLGDLKPLEFSQILTKACNDHVNDIGNSGAISHEGSNKETISNRVENYGEWDFVLCQNIDFGGKNINEIMISFITGDGDPSRVHRKNLFRDDINFVGMALGNHKETEVCTVVCFAGNVRELNTVAPEIVDFIPNYIKKVEEEKKNQSDPNYKRKYKTKFQIDDPDAPDDAVSFTTYKKMKLVDGRAKHCTQRIYTLTDGTQHIVEVFDDLKVKCDTSLNRPNQE